MALQKAIFPINRSLTGEGVRETLRHVQEHLPDLVIHSVPSGTEAFDWVVPNEWEITEAFIENSSGERVVDFANNNLHVVGYSMPVDVVLSLDDLQEHLHSLPNYPNAIPYVTSYYSDRWGFCLTHHQREALTPGTYRAVIRSRKFQGVMNYAELVIPGESSEEVFHYLRLPSVYGKQRSIRACGSHVYWQVATEHATPIYLPTCFCTRDDRCDLLHQPKLRAPAKSRSCWIQYLMCGR